MLLNRRFQVKGRAVVTSLCLLGLASVAHADRSSLEKELTVYHGHGVDSDLLELPKKIFTGDLEWEPSYFEAVGYTHPLPVPQWLDTALSAVYLSDSTTAIEGIAVQHRGLQHNFETSFAYLLRTDYWAVTGVRFRIGAGLGLSYAFGTPSYEDGPKDNPTKRYRFQNYNAYELETSLAAYPSAALALRVHHRSGAYGLIAPRRVGSNFLTVGLRYKF
ncbi:MAG: hypothetical protein VXW65_05990 [Pseudomonadota bacterium]|nr:hypothetical protein [Pseudomonadota bacterium]